MGIMKRKQETLLPPISDPTPPPPTQLRDAHQRKPANCVTCVVIAARDLRAADGGWLTRGSSDPYVKVIVESVAQQTTHKNRTRTRSTANGSITSASTRTTITRLWRSGTTT